jgi:CRP-like cAMP-binding protein
MTIDLEILKVIPYFASLDRRTLAELAVRVRHRTHRRGETVLTEGETCEGLSFVASGRVKVFKVSADGKEQVLKILGPGCTCNDVPVFDGGANPASIVAVERATIGLVPTGDVLALLEQHPGVARAATRVLATRLRALTLVVEDLSFRTVVGRVAKLLLDCARGRSSLVEGASGPCTVLTQQQIAAMTGTVREVVQRALKMLEREGAIEMERAHVRVIAPEVLETWADATRPLSV